MINWERFREPDGTINLLAAYVSVMKNQVIPVSHPALDFLVDVTKLTPIRSRQVAAVAITQALSMTGWY